MGGSHKTKFQFGLKLQFVVDLTKLKVGWPNGTPSMVLLSKTAEHDETIAQKGRTTSLDQPSSMEPTKRLTDYHLGLKINSHKVPSTLTSEMR